MAVIEKINEINDIVKEIFEFTQTNEKVKSDFDEYLATIGARNISLNQMEKIFLPYIFERRIEGKSILEMFKEEKGLTPVLESFLNTQASIFEIKKILKNGFELYNLINERTYKVLSLTKMTNFRGVYAGQYIAARIFELDGEYYVIEISSVLSHEPIQCDVIGTCLFVFLLGISLVKIKGKTLQPIVIILISAVVGTLCYGFIRL